MSGTTVYLDDVCNYLLNVAANHTTRTSRSQHAASAQAEEQVTFVLRRCVEELQSQYSVATRMNPGTVVSNQTYRNRATG